LENKKGERKMKILLVEDEECMRSAVERLLLDQGWEVVTADNGKDAQEKLVQNIVDIILSDKNMPWVGGLQLLEYVKEKYPQVKFILMSGEDLDEKEKMAGFDGFVSKKDKLGYHILQKIKEVLGK
jgi:DNA-binding NtrC family response regulator